MNILDYWHIKLMEESAEVTHRCAKILQYGPEEIQSGNEKDNAARLRAEILDLLSVITLMEQAGAIDKISGAELELARTAKRAKLAKYFRLSFELGRVAVGGPVSPP